jgi:tetratricopeptide (TPR) repeat protein
MRLLLVPALLLLLAAPAAAALDPEARVPYQLRIVVRIAEHPHFTDHFRREFRREIQADLRAALGPLGKVEVIDLRDVKKEKWEPLWKQVEEHGLESLDGFTEVGGGKTHFVQLDYRDGRYELRARQADGTAGFASPIVRKAETPARGFVARAAGLMIGRDFGFVATLDAPGAGPTVILRAKAGDLGPLDKWVKPGEVFAVVQIRNERRRGPAAKGARAGTVQAGTRVDGLLLRVEGVAGDGRITCRMFSRYEDPLPLRGVVGYRCVKLGTEESAPLRLRLTDADGVPHRSAALNVYARADDFPDGAREVEQAPAEGGLYTSKGKFAHVAFVRVLVGARRLARIPVEIMDDGPQTRVVRLDPGAEERDRLESERRSLLTRITDHRLIQARVFQEITALEQTGKKQEAYDRGAQALKTIDETAGDLQEETGRLREKAKALPGSPDVGGDCELQLGALRAKQDELRQHLDGLKVAIAEDADPAVQAKKKKLQDLVRAAELNAAQADYDKALKSYEEALAAAQDEPAAKQRIEMQYAELQKAWALKDAAHAEARTFIYDVWPKLGTPVDVRGKLPDARRAFEKCKSVGDRLSINKMQLASVEVAARFGDELKKLIDSAKEEEDRKALEEFQKVNEDLQKLLREVQDYLVAGMKK